VTAQCQRAPLDWSWPAIPVLVFCEDWPGFGPYHRRPCSSPRRNQCRPGGIRCWWGQESEGAQARCLHPFAGVRASDWLKELALDDG
jgi:hypothetical protein